MCGGVVRKRERRTSAHKGSGKQLPMLGLINNNALRLVFFWVSSPTVHNWITTHSVQLRAVTLADVVYWLMYFIITFFWLLWQRVRFSTCEFFAGVIFFHTMVVLPHLSPSFSSAVSLPMLPSSITFHPTLPPWPSPSALTLILTVAAWLLWWQRPYEDQQQPWSWLQQLPAPWQWPHNNSKHNGSNDSGDETR